MRALPSRLPDRLVNTRCIEALPAALLHARDNRSARRLAGADWLLRRKRDGRYLACIVRTGAGARLQPLHGAVAPGAEGLDEALAALGLARVRPHMQVRAAAALRPLRAARTARPDPLPLHGLGGRLAELGIDAEAYSASHGLALVGEPAELAHAGRDRYGRPLFLLPAAARAWRAMQAAAHGDGVVLQAISGYRSHDYQLGIFRRKLARGQSVAQILRVNTAPGWSEHHSGRALDLGTPGEPPAEESFESTPAFAWLQAHAAPFGFLMSYPRDNPHGIVHEPWHWCWQCDNAP